MAPPTSTVIAPSVPPILSTPQPTADLWTRQSSSEWQHICSEGTAPQPRSGHAAVGLGSYAMVLGGAGADRKRFDDVWKLELSKLETTKSSKVEMRLDAWPIERAQAVRKATRDEAAIAAAAAAAAASEAAKKPAAKGKGGKAAPPPKKDAKKGSEPEAAPTKPGLQLEQTRSCLGAMIGIPPAALEIEIAEPAEVAPDVDGVTIWLSVRPLRGVGLTTLQVDGEALPEAAMTKLEVLLKEAMPAGENAAAPAAPAKGGAAAAKPVGTTADIVHLEYLQRRLVGHRLLGWKKYTETTTVRVPAVCWTQTKVLTAAEAAAVGEAAAPVKAKPGKDSGKGKGVELEVTAGPSQPPARAGHSATLMASGGLIIFGGMTDSGIAGDVWRLSMGEAYVWHPVVPSGAPTSAGRAYHGAMARPAPLPAPATLNEGAREQLIVFGGSDGKSAALASIAVLTFPEVVWSSPRTSGPAPVPRGWAASVGLGDEAGEWRGLVFGGAKGSGAALHDAFALRALRPIEAPAVPPAEAKAKAPPKGKKGAPPEPEPKVPPPEPDPTFAWFSLPEVPMPALGIKGEARLVLGNRGGATLLAGAADMSPLGKVYTVARIAALEEGRDPDAEEAEARAQAQADAEVDADETTEGSTGPGPQAMLESARAAVGAPQLGVGTNTDAYRGQFENGQPHGHGICTYADGSVYEGEWVHGLRHGHGTLTLADREYVGGFELGQPEGEGTWNYEDGSKYMGELAAGMREGKGTLWMADAIEFTRGELVGSAIYMGGWAKDVFEGYGELRSEDGLVSYDGDFHNGLLHGSGVMRSRGSRGARPEVYDGQWRMGRRHGRGRCTYADGSVFEGEWMNNQCNGWGEKTELDGAKYAGKWVGGMRCGEGKWVAGGPPGAKVRKEIYQGQWLANLRHGRGRCEWPSGAIYEGEWWEGFRHGVGRLSRPQKGDIFDGRWSRDQRHGYGTQRYASGDEYRGQWLGDARVGQGELKRASGERYVGSWTADAQHGSGELLDEFGNKYTGQFHTGVRHGAGVCVYKGGTVYDGQWFDGLRQGRGKCTFPLAVEPRLAAADARPAAESAAPNDPPLMEEACAVYDGEWLADERCGHGRYVGAPPPHGGGEIYEGQWRGGAPHGRGKCTYADGDVYDGEWVEGQRHGEGSLSHPQVTFKLGEIVPPPEKELRGRPATAPGLSVAPKMGGAVPARPTTVQAAR